MPPKRHLAAASAFWADIGVSVQDQAVAASWAFTGPSAVPAEPGRRVLFEDLSYAWNSLSAPADRDRPGRHSPARLAQLERVRALLALADYGTLTD